VSDRDEKLISFELRVDRNMLHSAHEPAHMLLQMAQMAEHAVIDAANETTGYIVDMDPELVLTCRLYLRPAPEPT
jgi:hypothetical protein